MTARTDVTVDFSLSPRIILVAEPSTEITLQDLHDTLRDIEDEPQNMVYAHLINSSGKEDLGGGVAVGITSELQNAKLAFGQRATALLTEGVATSDNSAGIILTDASADFNASNIIPGSTIFNFDNDSIATVIAVLSPTSLRHFVLGTSDGYDGYWTTGDNYSIYPNIQCSISGGNLVAVDAYGVITSPVFPTANVQIVRTSSSSATLQSQLQLEHSTFNGGVTVDVTSAFEGTAYPVGTQQQPVNNTLDALIIAAARGFTTIFVVGDITIDSGLDYSNMSFVGASKTKSTITITSSANVTNSEFNDCTITGTLDGGAKIEDCQVSTLNYVDGFIENCILSDVITLSGSGTAHFLNCFSGIPGSEVPEINMGGSGSPLAIRGYNGGIKITNHSGIDAVSIDMNAGYVLIDSTVTDGTILVRGVTKLTDNSTGNATVDSSDALIPSRVSNTQFLIESLRPHHTGFGTVYYWDPINGYDGYDSLAPPRARKTLQSIIDDLVVDNNHDIIMCLPRTDGYDTVVDQTADITKSYVFIRGPGRDFVMRPSADPSAPTIEIGADGVEVAGMIVDGYATSAIPSYTIHSTGDFTYLHDLIVGYGSKGGIEISRGSNSIIDSCRIENNTTYGIDMHNAAEGSIIRNCILANNTLDGIRLKSDTPGDTTATLIRGDNIIYGNGGYAINIETNVEETLVGSNVAMWNNTLGNILDNGTNTSYSGVLEREFTSVAVWDEPAVTHNIPGTTGEILRGTAFDSMVEIDVVNGTSGITYPAGTPFGPVNNWAEARNIAAAHGYTKFDIRGNLTIGATESIDGYELHGKGATINVAETTVTFTDGASTSDARISNARVEGKQSGEMIYENCIIGNITNTHCAFNNCALIGPVQVVNSGWTVNHTTVLSNCYTSFDWYTLDYNDSPIQQVYRNFNGRLRITNFTNSLANIFIQFDGGELWLDSTCTDGYISVSGNCNLIDNSNGVTIGVEPHISRTGIADAVLDGYLADHTMAGTVGEALGQITTLDSAQIAATTTVSAGSTSTVIPSGLTQSDNFFDGMLVQITNSAGIAVRLIDEYANSGGTISVSDAFPFTPAEGDTLLVLSPSHTSKRGGLS